jgi:hypothetical protein
MVSKMNAADNKGLSIGQIYGKIGFAGLWKGLTTRILMVGTLTGLQWWIYDSFKTAVGESRVLLPAAGHRPREPAGECAACSVPCTCRCLVFPLHPPSNAGLQVRLT